MGKKKAASGKKKSGKGSAKSTAKNSPKKLTAKEKAELAKELSGIRKRDREIAEALAEDGATKTAKQEAERVAAAVRTQRANKSGKGFVGRASDRNVLFVGGRKANSAQETGDDAFWVADVLLNRRKLSDEEGKALYHKRGQKKGRVKFRGWRGSLKEHNEKLIEKHKGKKIRLTVKYNVIKHGVVTRRQRTRTVEVKEYRNVVDAYVDIVRAQLKDDSDIAFITREVTFTPVTGKKRNGKGGKARASRKDNRVRRGGTPSKQKEGSGKSVARGRNANNARATGKKVSKKR